MSSIAVENVSFAYPEGEGPVFRDLNVSLPAGVVSLIGQNGTGKSTFLLLAGGSAVPDSGSVRIAGVDTRELRDERERQRYVSFIFQNMEFETEEAIGDLLRFVYDDGFHQEKEESFLTELVSVFELQKCLSRRTQQISKGELQRTILAFSLLYGSRLLLMDEPIFALEPYQKERAMVFLTDYARRNEMSIYYSVHELDISQKYSDYLMLFYKDQPAGNQPLLGPAAEVFDPQLIEEAYEIPMDMLKKRESIFREAMRNTAGNL